MPDPKTQEPAEEEVNPGQCIRCEEKISGWPALQGALLECDDPGHALIETNGRRRNRKKAPEMDDRSSQGGQGSQRRHRSCHPRSMHPALPPCLPACLPTTRPPFLSFFSSFYFFFVTLNAYAPPLARVALTGERNRCIT